MKQNFRLKIIIFLLVLNIISIGYIGFRPRQPLQNPQILKNKKNLNTVLVQASAYSLINRESQSGIDLEKIIKPLKHETQSAGDFLEINNPQITAKSAIVKDITTGKILFEKNTHEQLPIASLTKIMTGLVVLENENTNPVKITKQAIAEQGQAGDLILGEKIAMHDLLEIMLITSSNDAAQAFNDFLPDLVELMNNKARKISLKNTFFTDTSGLGPGNVATAHDLINLVEYSFDSKLWKILSNKEKTVYSLDKKFIHNLKNTNQLLGQMPSVISGKTGYTSEAGQTLIILAKAPNKDNLVSIVLGSEDRFYETQKLLEWCFENYNYE